jgi:DmsE family decaheme c-type cytochrome
MRMSCLIRASALLALVVTCVGQTAALRAEVPAAAAEAVRVCTKCHDETEANPVLSILKTPHAVTADSRTPFADQACMTCHGPSEAHVRKSGDGERAEPDIVFDADAKTPVAERNRVCLDCHESGLRMHWRGSTHDNEGVACSSCHAVHAGEDPVLAKDTQSETCFTCHRNKRAEIHRPSSHPLLEGEMACSDCHNPHGSSGPKLLVQETVNETCYTCHAEKRGPFLWEHAPVREDCTLCHKPHGSVHANLLKTRGPWLCQQCHLAQQHPSTAYSGTGLPGTATPSGAQQLLGRNCLNCHSQVHGSNHPSGVRKTR